MLCKGRVIYAKTQSSNDDEYLWMTDLPLTYVRFKVQACKDVQTVLSPYVDSTNDGNQIVIGGEDNQKTSIIETSSGEEKSSASTPDILHCDEPRWFWVSIVVSLLNGSLE